MPWLPRGIYFRILTVKYVYVNVDESDNKDIANELMMEYYRN